MPKLTNKCAICGKPILKSWTICDECQEKNIRLERELQMEVARTHAKLLPEFLWEKRRAEYAGQALVALISNLDNLRFYTPEIIATKAVTYADALVAELRKDEPKK